MYSVSAARTFGRLDNGLLNIALAFTPSIFGLSSL